MNLVVVIPSRGRPKSAREAVQAIRDTADLVTTSVVVAIDEDDPCASEYRAWTFAPYGPEVSLVTLRGDETGGLIRATNTVARRIAAHDPDAIIGNLGDDHRTRTRGWDRLVADALVRPGIAYGDDLIHGARLPSAPFVSASIVNALGWYFLPTAEHMYGDDALRVLGESLGRLRYLPDVVIEHLHPAVHKAPWDDGYARAYATVEADQAAYNEWHRRYLKLDLRNVRRALA
jgi:hypothetical protein